MLKKIKKLTIIIVSVVCLTVNSIGASYMKPIYVNAAALPVVYVGVDTLLKLLLGTVITVGGVVAVNKADELGVFDDVYDSFITEGTSALKEMPDYDENKQIGKINNKIVDISDYIDIEKNSSGGGKQPDLNNKEVQKALKATTFMIESDFMRFMIDFVEDKFKADSSIESVREYYKKYGKNEVEKTENTLSSYSEVDSFNKNHDSGLFYDGTETYWDWGTKFRICKFRFENVYGYSPSGLSREGYYTDTSGYQLELDPTSNSLYNGGRVALTCQRPIDREQKDEIEKESGNILFDSMLLLYEVNGDTTWEVYRHDGSLERLQGKNFKTYSNVLTLYERDYETGYVGPNNFIMTTSHKWNCYPSSNVPVFTNYYDAVRYVMGIDGLENAINVKGKYTLPCDELLPKANELLNPLTDKELNAGILPEVITQAEQAILPEPLPENAPVKQPQDFPEEYPDNIGDIIGDLVVENIVTNPIPTPTPTPSPNPDPLPDIDPTTPETDNETIQNAINKSLNLADFFPFCIPFDLIRLVNVLNVEPQPPYFEYPIKIEGVIDYIVIIDFSKFDSLAQIVRIFEVLIFIGALIMATRKLIKG